jgi:hypothetical protein
MSKREELACPQECHQWGEQTLCSGKVFWPGSKTNYWFKGDN